MHRRGLDGREAGRFKAVILLASGWGVEAIAGALTIDAQGVRNHFERR